MSLALTLAAFVLAADPPPAPPTFDITRETAAERDARMAWWREARFGMFIHWGLYAIPAGEWNGTPYRGVGEWIMHNAQVRPADYAPLRERFNPVEFDARRWVSIAKAAGMRYLVITSKHHDGFCLWDSKLTDWDIMATPFGRDALKELAAACAEGGIRFCLYHSIMDWTHPDYLPRRPWDDRPADGADFERYKAYLRGQLAELLSGEYGDIGILWFDGEWENTWSHEEGVVLDDWVRGRQPAIIVNNRVDIGREGMQGMSRGTRYRGDYGTPEQEIPATGVPGLDWETCMTMNRSWGYHRRDEAWKDETTLIRMLVDIASKGGNFLLNVGPDELGRIPEPSVERLEAMGRWLATNGEAIYGTKASPFPALAWGRATTKAGTDGTALYAIVFDWPADGRIVLPGLLDEPVRVRLLGDSAATVTARAVDEGVELKLPARAPDTAASVVEVTVAGTPRIVGDPVFLDESDLFLGTGLVRIAAAPAGATVRYTLDGSEPTAASPIAGAAVPLDATATVAARTFVGERPAGSVTRRTYRRVEPRPAVAVANGAPGLAWRRWEGTFDSAAEPFPGNPVGSGVAATIGIVGPPRSDFYALEFTGWIEVPADGIYRFSLGSDDGSVAWIGDAKVVDNDGLHSMRFLSGEIALARGAHPITVRFFERDGGDDLELHWSGPGVEDGPVPASAYRHRSAAERP